LLTPRNHGYDAWVFLSSFGGGLVDGDALDVEVEVQAGARAVLGTQASTKVYRSPRGCGHRLRGRVGDGGSLVLLPDPVVCFAGSRYAQSIDLALQPSASAVVMDGYTSGRSARGERWAFWRYASRTTVTREDAGADPRRLMVDATVLDAADGSIAARMGRFDAVLSLAAFGPRFLPLREAILAAPLEERARGRGHAHAHAIVAASPLGEDGCIVRVAAERFETASLALRSSFSVLAGILGDDPFARKW
jgi:urease accessory protein